ncbi:MAG: LysR family transcriptional regulator [Pusillimonas sp.]|nr:MAG: LysR family transcriptional regulator [Pusillimonas sp.]
MELRHLRYFVALADCLNFTRAAERVHVTQSTLSHQIRQLEEEIGELLFDRVGKRVVITEQGELFLSYAARALKEVDLGMGALKESAQGLTGKLRVGATHTFSQGFISECIATLLVRHPTVKVTASEFIADEIGDKLVSGMLDLGISYRPRIVSDLRFEPLYSEQMVLVVAPRHPLAGRKRIRLAELHHQPLVLLPEAFATRGMLDECFRACDAEPLVVAEMNTLAPMLALVERTQIGAIVSENAVQERSALRAVPLESPTPMRTPGILWKRDTNKTAPMRAFASIVRAIALSSRLRRPSA